MLNRPKQPDQNLLALEEFALVGIICPICLLGVSPIEEVFGRENSGVFIRTTGLVPECENRLLRVLCAFIISVCRCNAAYRNRSV